MKRDILSIKNFRSKLMKLLISLALVAYASAIQLDQTSRIDIEFNAWASKHNKNYKNNDERSQRKNNWAKNNEQIANINANRVNTFKVGHNNFSDLTRDEYLAFLGDTGATVTP